MQTLQHNVQAILGYHVGGAGWSHSRKVQVSGVATGGQGGRVPPLTAKILPKIGKKRGKSGKIGKKEAKSGRKGQNREGSFTLPLLTDRAGYATAGNPIITGDLLNLFIAFIEEKISDFVMGLSREVLVLSSIASTFGESTMSHRINGVPR